jgi:hypothetical protein
MTLSGAMSKSLEYSMSWGLVLGPMWLRPCRLLAPGYFMLSFYFLRRAPLNADE